MELPNNYNLIEDFIPEANIWMVGIYFGDYCPIIRFTDRDKDVAKRQLKNQYDLVKNMFNK